MRAAIITGASSGIGRQFALQLYNKGEADFFYIVARRRERLAALKDELGGNAKIIEADLTTAEGIASVKEVLEGDNPSVQYLVNASGFGKFGDYSQLSERDVSDMIDLNVKALVLITHMCVKYMPRGSHIIQLGSGSCFTPLPNFNVYASSKSFVLHYTKALKYELKPLGISATAFCPGWVKTEFLGIATEDTSVRTPKKYSPLLDAERVVAKAIRDAKKGKVMSVTNWFTKLQHVMFKLLPDSILSRAWLSMLKKPNAGDK